MFEKDLRIPLLLDVYGELLSDRKREMMEYYYSEDYSLSEISEITGISRQGVRDSLKKSVAELHELEEKLRMADRLHTFRQCLQYVSLEIASVMDVIADDKAKRRLANVLKSIADTEQVEQNENSPADE